MWRVSTVLDISGCSTPKITYAEETRVRGTAVHAANEALAEGYTPHVEVPEHQPYIDGLASWYRGFAPQVIATERRIVNRSKRLTGQIDLVALIADARGWLDPYIVDVKTGSKAPWHGMQTAGYKDLALEDEDLWALMPPPFSKWSYLDREKGLRRSIIYLPGDGTAAWVVQNDPSDHYRFSAALGLMQWRYEHGLLTYTDPEQPDDTRPAVHVMPASEGAF
jgi:hypothetical protein